MTQNQIIEKLLSAIRFTPNEVNQLMAECNLTAEEYTLSDADARDGVPFAELVGCIDQLHRAKASAGTQRSAAIATQPAAAAIDDDDDDDDDEIEPRHLLDAIITR